MKKLLGLFAVVAVALSASASASLATLLVNDNFNRGPASLNGTAATPGPAGGPWTSHSGTAGQVQVNNQITIVQGTPTEDVNIPTGATLGTGGRWYAGFDVAVTQQGTGITSAYFAHFLTGVSSFDGRVWVTAPTTSGFRFALSNDNSITDADGEVFTGDLVLGQTYRAVVSYDFTGQNARLWLNQAAEGGSSIGAADPGFSDAATAFAFRQATVTASTGGTTQTIDNLCLGTSYNEAFACVPEPASLVLFGMGLVGLLRRKR